MEVLRHISLRVLPDAEAEGDTAGGFGAGQQDAMQSVLGPAEPGSQQPGQGCWQTLVQKVSDQSSLAGFPAGVRRLLLGKPRGPAVEGIPGAADLAAFAKGRGRRPYKAGPAQAWQAGRIGSQETITAWSPAFRSLPDGTGH